LKLSNAAHIIEINKKMSLPVGVSFNPYPMVTYGEQVLIAVKDGVTEADTAPR
jgi:hypothetical protein